MTLPPIAQPPTPFQICAQQHRLGLSDEAMARLYNFGHVARWKKLKAENEDGSPKTTLSGPGSRFFWAIEGDVDLDALIAEMQGKSIYLLEPNSDYLATVSTTVRHQVLATIGFANKRDYGVNRARKMIREDLYRYSEKLLTEEIHDIAANAIIQEEESS